VRRYFPAAFLSSLLIASCGLGITGVALDGPEELAAGPMRGSDGAAMADVVVADVVQDAGPPPADAQQDGRRFPADPGTVACGPADCVADASRCCVVGMLEQCQTPATTCTGMELNCDERADCPSPQVCCIGPDNYYDAASSYCMASCVANHGELCKSDDDCAGGMPCVPITCGTRKFATCGGVKPDPWCR
jgi:hypothetical protein